MKIGDGVFTNAILIKDHQKFEYVKKKFVKYNNMVIWSFNIFPIIHRTYVNCISIMIIV